MPNLNMYLRTKKVKGKTYYYLVEYSKESGKIKQKVVAYLGNAKKIKKMSDFYNKQKKVN